MNTLTNEPRAVVSAQLPAADAERLRKLAQASQRSLAGELRHAVALHLEASEKPQP
jgi:hypothetical protein